MFSLDLVEGAVSALQSIRSYNTPDSILRTASRGDIIEFNRGVYSHYALILGPEAGNQVVNVSAEDKNKTSAKIEILSFDQVCRDCSSVKISNHDDIALKYYDVHPKAVEEIVRTALTFVDHWWDYEFMGRNCEFYSTFWRFGVGFSTQVVNGKKQTSLTTRMSVPIFGGTLAMLQSEATIISEYNRYKSLRPSRSQ